VLADLACAIADGAEVISDFCVMGDQEDPFGLVASVPTVWCTLDEIARDGRTPGKIGAAVNAALGLEALDRVARGEPLWRVHECVFAVLALESEPVDPRL
jgi:hypothetical protein